MLVANNFEALKGEVIDVGDGRIEFQCWKRKRFPTDLFSGLIKVIHVEMRITKGVNERSRFKSTHLRHHMRQERIGCNVERNAKEDVSTSLIELAIQFTISNMELEKGMTRHQGHFIKFTNVPS